MTDEERFIAKCEEQGEKQVRDNLNTHKYNKKKATWAANWIENRERARAEASQAEEASDRRSSTKATRDQADAAKEANRISKQANFPSKVALGVSIFCGHHRFD